MNKTSGILKRPILIFDDNLVNLLSTEQFGIFCLTETRLNEHDASGVLKLLDNKFILKDHLSRGSASFFTIRLLVEWFSMTL